MGDAGKVAVEVSLPRVGTQLCEGAARAKQSREFPRAARVVPQIECQADIARAAEPLFAVREEPCGVETVGNQVPVEDLARLDEHAGVHASGGAVPLDPERTADVVLVGNHVEDEAGETVGVLGDEGLETG